MPSPSASNHTRSPTEVATATFVTAAVSGGVAGFVAKATFTSCVAASGTSNVARMRTVTVVPAASV